MNPITKLAEFIISLCFLSFGGYLIAIADDPISYAWSIILEIVIFGGSAFVLLRGKE